MFDRELTWDKNEYKRKYREAEGKKKILWMMDVAIPHEKLKETINNAMDKKNKFRKNRNLENHGL